MSATTTAVIGLVGVALGAALSFLAQYALANRTHKWELEDTKRKSYAEFLTSISASYAKAAAHEGDPQEADLLRATSIVELIADEKVSEQARSLQKKVTEVHGEIRQAKTRAKRSAAEKKVPGVDDERRKLIKLFKTDLDIPS
jgi:hypothetical protein